MTSREASVLLLNSSEIVAVGWLEGQHRLLHIVPDVIVHLHDVPNNGQARRLLHDPAADAVVHGPEVVLRRQIHVAAVEVQHHGREDGAGRLEADLVPVPAGRHGEVRRLRQDRLLGQRVRRLREERHRGAGVEDDAAASSPGRRRGADRDALQVHRVVVGGCPQQRRRLDAGARQGAGAEQERARLGGVTGEAVGEGADVELRDEGQRPAAEADEAGARAVPALRHGGAAEADAGHGVAAEREGLAPEVTLCVVMRITGKAVGVLVVALGAAGAALGRRQVAAEAAGARQLGERRRLVWVVGRGALGNAPRARAALGPDEVAAGVGEGRQLLRWRADGERHVVCAAAAVELERGLRAP